MRAESTFRVGVALPMFAACASLAVILGFGFVWWLIPVAGVASIVLIVQSVGIDHRRKVLMANALYQGIAEDLHSKSVAAELAKMEFSPRGDAPESLLCAATAVAMHRIGDYEGANSMVWEAADEIREYVEGADSSADAEVRFSEITGKVRDLLTDYDAVEYLWVFNRRVERNAGAEVASADA